MQAYTVYWEKFQTGYGGDSYHGEILLALPEARIKIPFSKWHLLHPNKDNVSFLRNIRKYGDGNGGFGEEDVGLELLTTLSPEEWTEHMEQEVGFSNRKYGDFPVEVNDDLVNLLRKKVDGETEFDEEIDRQLRSVILN